MERDKIIIIINQQLLAQLVREGAWPLGFDPGWEELTTILFKKKKIIELHFRKISIKL